MDDAIIGEDCTFLESVIRSYRAAERYHYEFETIRSGQYLVVNPTTGERNHVTIGGIGHDFCDCEVFALGSATCIHVEHLRLRLGLPSPSIAMRDATQAIYAWFDKSSMPARIRLGCIGDCLAVARDAVKGLSSISDETSLQLVRTRVEERHIPFWVLTSARLALVTPKGIPTDSAIAERVSRCGRENLQRSFPQLKQYQTDGAIFLASAQRALLLDEMGLGKTLQAIAATHLLQEFGNLRSCLVIAPKSVLDHWSREIARFTQHSCTIVTGDAHERQQLYGRRTLFKIVTLDSFRRDVPQIGCPDLIIVDEVQKLRDVTTLSNRVVRTTQTRFFFGLSGTAIEKGLDDLYGVLRAAQVPDLEAPLQFYASHMTCDEFGKVTGALDPELFFVRYANRILRRLKVEAEPNLPELRISEIDLDLTALQERLADPLLNELDVLRKRLNDRYELNDFIRARWLINRLVEVSDSSALVDPTTNQSSKLTWLDGFLRDMCLVQRQKVVVFTRWTRSQRLICDVCRHVGVQCETLSGEDSMEQRQAAIEHFRADDQKLVFVSTDAGGLGVNLQFAQQVVVFEPSWNPSTDAQRIQRMHRLGQTNPVEARYLFTSLDLKFVLATHGKKMFAADAIDAVRTPDRSANRPTWPELYPVISFFREGANRE